MHCHASVYVPYKRLGGGDLMKGFEVMNQIEIPGGAHQG
jgi:nitrite reductase (cytochrome c-552)